MKPRRLDSETMVSRLATAGATAFGIGGGVGHGEGSEGPRPWQGHGRAMAGWDGAI